MDKTVYLGVQNNVQDRINILQIQLKGVELDCQQRMQFIKDIEHSVPNNMTGADWQGLVQKATFRAVNRLIQSIKGKSREEQKNSRFRVNKEDFEHALSEFRNSVTEEEIKKYESLRDQYK